MLTGIAVGNILQAVLFGWVSVPVNMLTYLVRYGQAPERSEAGRTTGVDYWAGNFAFVLPWWYFALTGLIYLAVVIVVTVRPSLVFVPTNPKYALWRTTPLFLGIAGIVLGFSLFIVVRYHTTLESAGDPYLVGTYLCLVGAAISMVMAVLARRARRRGAVRRSRAGAR